MKIISRLRALLSPATEEASSPTTLTAASAPEADLTKLESPISERSQDLLDRYAVARALHRSIATAPAGWSTRIGLYGPWGSGKTSVLRLLAQLERERGNVVVQFSAWRATGEGGVLGLFYEALVDQLRRDGINVEPILSWGKRTSGKLAGRLKGLGDAAVEAGGLADNEVGTIASGAGMAASVAGTLISDWAEMKSEDLSRLHAQLGGRRVVVFIDDIDRADPRAVPKTLLALRELLNWPEFAFVLAFDRTVVARALAEYSKAYGELAEVFLEKVVDIGFDLPEPTVGQAHRLGRRALDACCDFIPLEIRESLAAWMPTNPRQAKLAARKLGVLRDVALRHEDGEIHWRGVGLQSFLRTLHPSLANWLEDGRLGVVSEEWAGFILGESTNGAATEIEQSINRLTQGAEPAAKARLVDLVRAVAGARRTTTPERIRYEMRLLFDEPAVTLKELRELVLRLDGALQPAEALVEAELVAAANRSCRTRDEAASEILSTAITCYSEALESASEVTSSAEHARHIAAANSILTFLETLRAAAMPPEVLRALREPQFIGALYEVVLRWVHFTGNAADLPLREREADLLRNLATASSNKSELFMKTRPSRLDRDRLTGNASRRALAETVRAALEPGVVEEVVGWFLQARMIASALREEPFRGASWLLASAESPLYASAATVGRLTGVFEALAVSTEGSRRALAADDVLHYIQLLLGNTRAGTWMRDEQLRQFFAAFPSIPAAAWRLLTVDEVQFRALHGLRELREALVANGVPEAELPLPEWLPAEASVDDACDADPV
jgi:hypothetical protein